MPIWAYFNTKIRNNVFHYLLHMGEDSQRDSNEFDAPVGKGNVESTGDPGRSYLPDGVVPVKTNPRPPRPAPPGRPTESCHKELRHQVNHHHREWEVKILQIKKDL